MRYVLVGDGDSPHLLKWARALAANEGIELWAVSSRGFMDGFDALVPAARRLALALHPDVAGGNVGVLSELPRVAHWLNKVEPDCIHAHYLTSHGTLAWLAKRLYRVPGLLVGSAWGSDILVTPGRNRLYRWITSRVLRACALATSDSQVMAERMRELGAHEVMVFPFGLEQMPELSTSKDDALVFANRGLEPIYAPERVLQAFAKITTWRPDARLVVANDGSLRASLERHARERGLADRVQFTGRLDAATQARWYAKARWYLSLPVSDSVSVSVLEAMSHGCIPILSDLPANRELVQDGINGMIVPPDALPRRDALEQLLQRADLIAVDNRGWVRDQALFGPCVERFLAQLAAM